MSKKFRIAIFPDNFHASKHLLDVTNFQTAGVLLKKRQMHFPMRVVIHKRRLHSGV